ncbi:hypothetical protein ACFFQW_26075 [Umezawaea endophytica]|uniref:Uncharacterized protein n=1 Tax=Umezawaea endophytica TaxID=1654476 RepID=A0A9X2VM37_9PSEU|nr:hypothetical protein [Umezawaea endophytica]MCS7479052.1 hypothetical protein [Umezawaea endophytica]
MARSGPGSPDTNTNTNPGSTPPAAPPPPPPSAPTGPTGTAGFSLGESSIATLQKHANDLESRYEGVSAQLSSQTLAFNALGMFGIPMAAAVNGSNSNSVGKAKEAAATMAKVNDGLKATAETHHKTDQFIADQFAKIVPDSGAKNPNGSPGPAPKPQTQDGPQVSKVDPVPGAPAAPPPAPPTQDGPQVSKVDPVPGSPAAPPVAPPTPEGPQVSKVDPVPGSPAAPPPAAQTPDGPPVSSFTPPPGATATPPPASPSPTGPPVSSFTPPPGNADTTTTTAATPPPAPPITPPPNIPGTPGAMPPLAPPPVGAMPPIGAVPGMPSPKGNPAPPVSKDTTVSAAPPSGPKPSSVPIMPGAPGGKGPVAPPVTKDTTVSAMWPPAGPRPGSVPNVPGVAGPPQGIFSPTPPAADSLRPIGDANPPSPKPPVSPPAPPVAPPPHSGVPGFNPKGDAAPPVVTGGAEPAPPKAPFVPPVPGESPTPPPVAPVKAPPNILDLLDPRGYPGGANLPESGGPKADGAWPATTIDGKPWADLSSLTPEQSQKWIDNLRNILSTKEDGAFFWSGSVYDSDGNRVSVMNEAEYMGKADGRNTLEGTLDDKAIKLPGWGNTSPEGKAVWDSVSASLAHGSSGDVYVLLGPARRPDNVFHMTEFPILQQNPNVNRVIAIDVQTKEETVIFTRP